jgi:hypothetical protein
MRIGLLVVLAGALNAGPAGATDEQVFNKFIAKVAPNFALPPPKPRVACVCLDASPVYLAPGFLLTEFGPAVRCEVPSFAADGSTLSLTSGNTYAVVGP